MGIWHECRNAFTEIWQLFYRYGTLHDHRKLVTPIDSIPDPGVVSSLVGADSEITCPCPIHCIMSALGCMCTRTRRGKMTYGAVRVFPNERVLERSVWGKVRRRGPHRVVGRIKRYLRVRGLVNQSSCAKELEHIPRWTDPRFRAPARFPRRKYSVGAKASQ